MSEHSLFKAFRLENRQDLDDFLTCVILSECVYKAVEPGGPERALEELLHIVDDEFNCTRDGERQNTNIPPLQGIQFCCSAYLKQKYLVAENKSSYFVVCMGSKEIRDLFVDINITSQQVHQDAGLAHRGFVERSKSVPVESFYIYARRKGKRLVMSGHSLGGAVAMLASIRLLMALEDTGSNHQVRCFSFGSPTLIDFKLARMVNDKGWNRFLNSYGVENDPVPWLAMAIQDATSLGKSSHKGEEKSAMKRIWKRMYDAVSQAKKKITGFGRFHHVEDLLVLSDKGVIEQGIFSRGVNLSQLLTPKWIEYHRMSFYRKTCIRICTCFPSFRCEESDDNDGWELLGLTEHVIPCPRPANITAKMREGRNGFDAMLEVCIKGINLEFVQHARLLIPGADKASNIPPTSFHNKAKTDEAKVLRRISENSDICIMEGEIFMVFGLTAAQTFAFRMTQVSNSIHNNSEGILLVGPLLGLQNVAFLTTTLKLKIIPRTIYMISLDGHGDALIDKMFNLSHIMGQHAMHPAAGNQIHGSVGKVTSRVQPFIIFLDVLHSMEKKRLPCRIRHVHGGIVLVNLTDLVLHEDKATWSFRTRAPESRLQFLKGAIHPEEASTYVTSTNRSIISRIWRRWSHKKCDLQSLAEAVSQQVMQPEAVAVLMLPPNVDASGDDISTQVHPNNTDCLVTRHHDIFSSMFDLCEIAFLSHIRVTMVVNVAEEQMSQVAKRRMSTLTGVHEEVGSIVSIPFKNDSEYILQRLIGSIRFPNQPKYSRL